MNKISGVYKIVNEITGDSYVGSSKDVKKRWADHKCPSTWKQHTNSPLYNDFQKYGVDKFRFQILAPVMEEYLTQVEQEFIEMLEPTYNNLNAKGRNVERCKERINRYHQSDKGKERYRKYLQTDEGKEARQKAIKRYNKTDKHKEAVKKCHSQLCCYNGEELTLCALSKRFRRAGIAHYVSEARKYLIIGE